VNDGTIFYTQDQLILFPCDQPPLAHAGKAAAGTKRKKASTDDVGGTEVPDAAAAKKHKKGAAPPVEDEGELVLFFMMGAIILVSTAVRAYFLFLSNTREFITSPPSHPQPCLTHADDDDDDDGDVNELVVRRTRATSVRSLRVMLDDPLTLVRIMVYSHYTNTAVDLIRQAEGHPDALPHDWAARMGAYKTWLRDRHINCPEDVDRAIAAAKVQLSAEQRQVVINDVVRAIEACWPRFDHMDASMPLWEMRAKWHPATPPATTEGELIDALGPFFKFGDEESTALQQEAARYSQDWHAGRLDKHVKPAAGKDGKPVYMKAATFWRLKTTKEAYPHLRRVALHYLSIPLSTASVERSFSKLTRMESPLRMRLLDKNVRRQHFIQCHKSAVVEKLAAAVDAYKKFVKK